MKDPLATTIMSSSSSSDSEQQPLLSNGGTATENPWEGLNGNALVEIYVENNHKGLSRRELKNGEAHHHHNNHNGSSNNGLNGINCNGGHHHLLHHHHPSTGGGGGGNNNNNNNIPHQENAVFLSMPPPEKEEPRFPPEKWKTFMAVVFFMFNVTLNLTCLATIHDRVPDRSKNPPLPDIFFDLFPPADWALDVSEIIIIVCIWSTLLFICIHRHRFIILRRVFFLMGLFYLMRSCTMFVTQVPVASTTYFCSPKENSTNVAIIVKRVLRILSGFGLSINGQHIYCGDYIYSGHTVTLTMSYLVIHEYTPRRWFLLHWLSWTASAAGVVFVLLSRGHYTVDVIIAYYVTTRVFWIYHTMCNNPILKKPGTNNFLSRTWWFCLFTYLEKNVCGCVPRQYEWPLPWPRRFLRRSRIS